MQLKSRNNWQKLHFSLFQDFALFGTVYQHKTEIAWSCLISVCKKESANCRNWFAWCELFIIIYNFPCFRSLIFTSDLSSFFYRLHVSNQNPSPPPLFFRVVTPYFTFFVLFSLTFEFSHKSHLIHWYRYRLNL